MSKEYIEREAALEKVIEVKHRDPELSGVVLHRYIKENDLKDIPAADVAPVRHGRWVHDHYEKCTEQFEIVKCSNCGIKMYAIALSVKDANYCRNCGAKMDGYTP